MFHPKSTYFLMLGLSLAIGLTASNLFPAEPAQIPDRFISPISGADEFMKLSGDMLVHEDGGMEEGMEDGFNI